MPKIPERIDKQSASSIKQSEAVELTKRASAAPAREQIEVRAYELYLQRGAGDGSDVQDWLQAESELLAEAEKASRLEKAVAA